MSLKFALVAVTLVAVASDTLLHPFYPQFFATAFGMEDPRHVGFYLGAVCFTAMLAFPFWAWVAEKIPALRLLVATQLVAGLLSIYCYAAPSLPAFWLASLVMVAFKASYLLIYPYVMSLEDRTRHGRTIGLLAVIVHFGAILGALLGGLVLETLAPRHAFLVMAGGDFAQMLVCAWVLRRGEPRIGPSALTPAAAADVRPRGFVYRLGAVMLLFYFSVYLSRPFFARYWETVSTLDSRVVSGFVFAIPGIVALAALVFEHYRRTAPRAAHEGLLPAMGLAVAGLLLQAAAHEALILAGRVVFGWALFRAAVRLDLLLFERSRPESYAVDFSRIHVFQNLGVLASSFAAGALVASYGLVFPLVAAAAALGLTGYCYGRWLKSLPAAAPVTVTAAAAARSRA